MKKKRNHILGSIPAKIVMIFLGLILPVYALLLISAGAYIRSLGQQARDNAQAILDLNLSYLEAELTRIDNYFFQVQESADYLRITELQDADSSKIVKYKLFREMVGQHRLSSFSEAWFLYHEPQDELLIVNTGFTEMSRDELYGELSKSFYIRENLRWRYQTVGNVPCLLHTVGSSGVYVGAVISVQALMDTVAFQLPYENETVYLANDAEVPENPRMSVSSSLHGTGQRIWITLDQNEIALAMPAVARVILIVGALLLVILPIGLIFTFMRMIVRPIRRIEEGMFHLASGEQDYRIPEFSGPREFVGMKNSFNNMAQEIETLKIQQYEEALEKEQMMLQNILLQIRPHFLLNFFNQIFSMAELEDYSGIKKSSLYLSQYFRHLFRSDRITKLQDELSLTDAYLELMDERFMGCFTVERDIDETLLSYRVPPLIVQNFVENIFKYAVSEDNFITIRLSLKREDGCAVMTVQDDGPGMEEEILSRIRENQPVQKTDGTHIGIYNSMYRLKKLCGEDCILDIQSVLTEGTTVKIKLPLKSGRDI